MIPAQVLQLQREWALSQLTERCEIHRYTETENDMGEPVKGWQPVQTDVPCRVVSMNSVTGRERQRLEAIGQLTQWQIPLPVGTDVTSRDRIFVVTSSPVRDFEVSQISGPHTDEVRLVAMVDEVS